ncbi:hypothetical protein [Streptomyces sp. NPDC002054]|uniref:hypothetical protein n=1 Tax=Streptomyces sp. NPDC002054 TaxID=3154663 RepID=UPI003326D7F1
MRAQRSRPTAGTSPDRQSVSTLELDAAADDDGGRVGGMTDPQSQAGEVVEDHAAGGADCLVAGIQPGHLLVAPEGPADLALDQAEHEQGQAARALLALVAPQHLGGIGLLGGEGGPADSVTREVRS